MEKTKAELFAESPDKFVNTDDIICAVGRSDKGMTLLMNPKSRSEIVSAFGELQLAVIAESIRFNDIVKAQKLQKPGGIINFARNQWRK